MKKGSFDGMVISQIVVVSHQGVETIEVGEFGFASIDNCSLEYDDHIHAIYHVYDENDKIIKVIENCPVVVTYFRGEQHD